MKPKTLFALLFLFIALLILLLSNFVLPSNKRLRESGEAPRVTEATELSSEKWLTEIIPAEEVGEMATQGTLTGAEALPQSEQQSLWNAFSEARHEIRPLTAHQQSMPENEGAHFLTSNPANKIRARFLDQGVRLLSSYSGRDWQGIISLNAGQPQEIRQQGSRVEYDYGKIVEWYNNKPEGIEQGWIVTERPAGTGKNITLSLSVQGLGVAPLAGREAGSSDLQLVNVAGEPVLSYSGLKAWDASGKALEVEMKPTSAGLEILVADSGAQYPILVDPLIASLEQKLGFVTGDGAASDHFGWSVSISDYTAVIGAPDDDDNGLSSGSAYVLVESGGEWVEQQKLTASDGTSYDYFGYSVSIFGDTVVVGATGDDDNGSGSGSVYEFDRYEDVWSDEQKLTASDGTANDQFGFSVAYDGSHIFVGAPYEDNGGIVYVFGGIPGYRIEDQKLTSSTGGYFGYSVSVSGYTALIGAYNAGNGSGRAFVFFDSAGFWSQEQELQAYDATQSDYFGRAVCVDGDTALVGSRQDDDNGTSSGSAYVYVRSTGVWSLEQKLTPADGASGDQFGFSVSLKGDRAAIGAPYESNSGSAYVFIRSAGVWSEQQKLTASNAAGGDQFGYALSIDNSRMLIGAPYADDAHNGIQSGSAYVFRRSSETWSEKQKVTAGMGVIGSADNFGQAVSISGDTAVIGALGDDDNGSASGSAYVFVRSNGEWEEEQKLIASDGEENDLYGTSVCVQGDSIVIGARNDDIDTMYDDKGSAYVYVRNAGVWTEQQKLTASSGTSDAAFGRSVSLDGDTAAVGAPDNHRVHIFVRSAGNWTEQQSISGSAYYSFGDSVSVSADTLLIGHSRDYYGGSNGGSAFVYVRDAGIWSLEQKLNASDGTGGDRFGNSVSLDGDTALIGAPYDYLDTSFYQEGSAYVFVRSGGVWSEEQKLTAADGDSGDLFGDAVSLDGDTALVGAIGDDDNGTNSGSVYVFRRDTGVWGQELKLTPDDGSFADSFGRSVDLSGSTALIGADGRDVPSVWGNPISNQGTAYVFNLIADTDGDGIADIYETNTGTYVSGTDTGTDPNNPDTDEDGINDGDELNLHGTDPHDSDSDGDGLSDGDEVIAHGTDPDDINTDDDGYNDGLEVAAGTDPADGNEEPKFGQIAKLLADDGAVYDYFGTSVSVSGDTAVVGAYADDDAGNGSGSAYVFTRSAGVWSQETKLVADDATSGDLFGYSVSVSGDTVLVGAESNGHAGAQSGAVYVFTRSAGVWSQQSKLVADDAASGDSFGYSVSVFGDTALVGARGDDAGGSESGSAYVFTRSAGVWSQETKLVADDAASGDLFGHSVSVSGDTALIGAFFDDDGGSNSGSAYVFTRSAGVWSQEAKLVADDAAAGNIFGVSVSVSGDMALVGAGSDDDGGSNSGSAYVFTRSGGVWAQQPKLQADDAAANDHFGESVSLSGDTLLVGARGDDDGGSNSGSAYVFTRSGGVWTQQSKLVAADAVGGIQFGYSVSVSDGTVLAGANYSNDNGAGSGAAYIYQLTKDNDLGSSAWQTANGFNPDIPNDESTLDSDGDGDLDIVEIFQGTDRNGAGEKFGLQNIAAASGSQTLSTTFRRSTTQTTVNATSQWSRNLTNWYNSGQSDGTVTVTIDETVNGGGTGYELVDVDVQVTSGNTEGLYYRILLTPNESP